MKSVHIVILIAALTMISCEKEGLDGFTSLIDIQPEPGGTNCSSGGLKIMTGIDFNKNGLLDTEEIDETEYVCNGEPGSDAKLSLIDIQAEPSGENCTSGGYKISSGFDSNQNSALDENEIQNISYLCERRLVGPQTDYLKNVVYKAETDGFLFVSSYLSNKRLFINPGFIVFADTTSNPTSIVAEGVSPSTMTIPIQSGFYWKVRQIDEAMLSIAWFSLQN